jgi:hypothetical protein
MKKAILLFIFFMSQCPPNTSAEITAKEITNAMAKELAHPYLFFNEKEKSILLQRIKNDAESSDLMSRLTAEADRLLYMPVDSNVPPTPKNPNYIGVNKKDDYESSYTEWAYTLAFVFQMTGEVKYANKAFEFLDCVCDIPVWSARYHQFPIIYTRVWPWNVPDDQVSFGYDIWVADISRKIAAAYDWLYPALDKTQRDRIRGALLEKAIIPVRGNYEYCWWATAYRCNWCGVCNSGLGCTAITLLSEEPRLVDVIAESYNRIDKMLDQIDEDGGWQEGTDYWAYGVSTSMIFAEALKRLTHGRYNLFLHPKIAKNTVNGPLYNFIPPNKMVNFADASDEPVGPTYLFNKLAEETGSGAAAWYRDQVLAGGKDLFDLIWPRSAVVPVLPEKTSCLFRGIDWAVMRSDFSDPDKVLVACKAGYNNDPHHGHLDCGTFVVYWRGIGFLSEMGRLVYDEQYFDDSRWSYAQVSSAGHNVVSVNGEQQLIAKRKNTPWKENVGGKILQFKSTLDRDYTLMNPSGAYPGEQLKGWRRHIILEKPNVTIVVDEVKSDKGAEIESRFHSQVNQKVKDGYLLLESDKGKMALIPISKNQVQLRPGKHALLAHMQNAAFTWFPYCGTVVQAHDTVTVVAEIILPVKDDAEAEKIVRSKIVKSNQPGSFDILFDKAGKTYAFNFSKGKDGLQFQWH